MMFKIDATWTDDCQGKKDYDGTIIGISTRYWPRGGSALIFNSETGDISTGDDPERQDIKPSAKSAITLFYKEDDELPDGSYDQGYMDLVAKEFEGDSEAEVKRQVEKWAQEKMNEIVSVLRKHYKK